jgi:hypothetical protein
MALNTQNIMHFTGRLFSTQKNHINYYEIRVCHTISYKGIRRRWCDAVLNAHTLIENKSDD